MNDGSSIGAGIYGDRSVMSFHNVFHDRKSETRSIRFCCMKRFKNMYHLSGIDSTAMILYEDMKQRIFTENLKFHAAAGRGAFCCILQQIDDRLTKL